MVLLILFERFFMGMLILLKGKMDLLLIVYFLLFIFNFMLEIEMLYVLLFWVNSESVLFFFFCDYFRFVVVLSGVFFRLFGWKNNLICV